MQQPNQQDQEQLQLEELETPAVTISPEEAATVQGGGKLEPLVTRREFKPREHGFDALSIVPGLDREFKPVETDSFP